VLVLTINFLLPLKTVKLYRMEVDKDGVQSVYPLAISEYMPSDNDIRARLKELTILMWTIDPMLSKNMKRVQTMMAGQARRQFTDFLSEEKVFARVAEHADLTRETKVNSVAKLTDNVFLIDYTIKERIGLSDAFSRRKTMTVSFVIKPAKTDEEVLGDNPAGIFVTSFTHADLN